MELLVRRARLTLLLMAAIPAEAGADPLQLRALAGAYYDDNLFRLPDGVAAPGGRDDLIVQTQAAARVEANVSLQRFVVDAAVTRNTFTQHKDFSFTGINGAGTWYWQIASRLSGTAGYEHVRRQSSFAEVRTGDRNIVTIRQPFVEARYQPGRALFAYGGYRSIKSSNTLPLLEVSDYRSDIYSGGLGYQLRNQGELKVGVRRTDTGFPTDQTVVIGGVPTALRNDYRLNEIEGQIVYPLSAKTLLRGRLAYTERKVEQAAGRNFSGLTGFLTLGWQPSELLSFQITPRRELTGVDDIQTNFVTADRLTGTINWQVKRYLSVRLDADTAKRRFEGFALSAPTAGRRDRDKTASLTASYLWPLGSRLDLSVRRETRDSTINALDYKATTGSAALTLSF